MESGASGWDTAAVKAAVSAGNFAYMQIPSDDIRRFCDHAIPALAKNSIADSSRGYMHRWAAGHDLLMDVPRTFTDKGFVDGMKHAGHILLTDFPTRDGIPIPGLSKCGLGRFLTETCNIPRPYLCLNVVDATVGIFAMSEGTLDMINVVSNQLRMTPQLFFDTFVEGAAEIAGGYVCKSPLLMISGAENIGAGLIATYNTVTRPLWYVDPLDFFSGSLTSALIALLVSRFILKRDTNASVKSAVQSAAVGGLFVLSPCFGFGGLAALLCSSVGKIMAEKEAAAARMEFAISEEHLAIMATDAMVIVGDTDDWLRLCEDMVTDKMLKFMEDSAAEFAA